MLDKLPIHAVISASDLKRAKTWYQDKLGLAPTREDQTGGLVYEYGGAEFYLYETPSAGTAKNTIAEWTVPDIRAAVAELRTKGVVFEEYDFPGLKTEDGIATLGNEQGAWFKDSEGNILAISQR